MRRCSGTLIFFLILLSPASSQEWYRSNQSGMILEQLFSSRLALREEYALEVREIPLSQCPAPVRPYWEEGFRAELRILYRDGKELRRQHLLIRGDVTRLTALLQEIEEESPSETAFPTETQGAKTSGTAPAYQGFIEVYDTVHRIILEREFREDGTEDRIAYHYQGEVPIRSEASRIEGGVTTALWTSSYRYSRYNSLRGLSKVYHQGSPGIAAPLETASIMEKIEESGPQWFRFPRTVQAGAETDPLQAQLGLTEEFFPDIPIPQGAELRYTTDSRGRVLSQSRYNAEGDLIGEVRNLWDGNRLVSVSWIDEGGTRRIEFEYREDTRIAERYYRGEDLERILRREGDMETEELYLQGRLLLRTVWQNGKKIREERENSRPRGSHVGSGG